MEKHERFDVQKTFTLIILELKRLRKEMRPFLTGEEANFFRHLNKAKEYVLIAELAKTTHRVLHHYQKLDSVTIAGIRKCISLLTGHKISPDLKHQFDLFDYEWRKKTLGKPFHNGD